MPTTQTITTEKAPDDDLQRSQVKTENNSLGQRGCCRKGAFGPAKLWKQRADTTDSRSDSTPVRRNQNRDTGYTADVLTKDLRLGIPQNWHKVFSTYGISLPRFVSL